MFADRKSAEVGFFKCNDGRTRSCCIFIGRNGYAVYLYACEFGEISVCAESQRIVTVLRPYAVCTLGDFILGYYGHGKIGKNPHCAVGAVALIAFIARIIYKFAVDLQLGVGSEYISGIFAFNIAHSFHIHTVMIGLPGFKSGDFVFKSAAEEICGNRTGFAVQFPPLAIVCILHAFGTLASKNGLVAILEADGDIVDLHYINNFHGGRRHGQYIAEPNGFAVIVYIDLIGCQGDFFAVDIELRVLIEAVALFHAQIGNLEIYAIGIAFVGFKFRNELTVIAFVPVVAGGNAITAAVIGVPPLMIGVNDRVNDTSAEKRFISGIKVDNGIKSDFFNSLTGAQLCSILNEAGFSVIHHHDP